jgi:cytochrome c553
MRVALLLLLAACVDQEPMLERDEQEGPPVDASPMGDFGAFIQCMSYDDFVASNMAQAWASLASTDGATCTSCHTTDGMFSGDAQRFFSDLKQRTYVQIQFFTFDRAQGIVDVNTTTIPRVGKAVAPYAEHPRFNATKGIDATYDFHERTLARLAAGNCQ